MVKRSTASRTFVWVILGLLIVGLAGFGATNLSGTVRTVATVGDQTISVDAYARELQREIRAIEAQRGQALPISEVQAMGLDDRVLGRLMALAVLDDEAARLGLSIGDRNLQREILAIPAFQGPDGSFDREAYRFALQNAGLAEAEFEEDLRRESARTLLQGAVMGGARMPDTLTALLTDYVGARRAFTRARLGPDDLAEPIPEPTEDELRAFHEENTQLFVLPESRSITYAWLTPQMIQDEVELDEAALRALYDENEAQYNQPERRLVERLAFPTAEAASDAMAQLEVGGTTFEQLVDQRGLSLSDVDLGDVARSDLGAAGEAVFAAEPGAVVGPVETSLGPALFRVNAVLPARSTSFEEAEPELREQLAAERARRQIEAMAQDVDDLLAGGATLEELADETEMQLGRIDWSAETTGEIADYEAFRDAAAAVGAEDFPEVAYLEDGGIFALRLDEVLPPRPQPFEDARAAVRAAWERARTEAALAEQAREAVAAIEAGASFEDAGLEPTREDGLTRSAFIKGAPQGFMSRVFDLEPGAVEAIPGAGAVWVVRMDEVLPPAESPEMEALSEALGAELDQTLAQALFDAYLRDAQLRAQPMVDQRALNAVNASFQ